VKVVGGAAHQALSHTTPTTARTNVYGRHPDPRERVRGAASAVLAVESTIVGVGDALTAFYGGAFYSTVIKPIQDGLMNFRATIHCRVVRVVRCGRLLAMACGVIAPTLPGKVAVATASTKRCLGKKVTITSARAVVRRTNRPDVIVVTRPSGATVRAGAGADAICGGRGPDRLFYGEAVPPF
jgi:hypothetical protein